MEFFSPIRHTPIRLYYSKFDTTGQQKSLDPAHKTPPLTANPSLNSPDKGYYRPHGSLAGMAEAEFLMDTAEQFNRIAV
jgi:hypothetical protein